MSSKKKKSGQNRRHPRRRASKYGATTGHKGSGAADSPRKQSVSTPLLFVSPQYPSKQFHIALRLIDWRFVEELRSKERKGGRRGRADGGDEREREGEGVVEGNKKEAI